MLGLLLICFRTQMCIVFCNVICYHNEFVLSPVHGATSQDISCHVFVYFLYQDKAVSAYLIENVDLIPMFLLF